jgi:hypothetical protein
MIMINLEEKEEDVRRNRYIGEGEGGEIERGGG